MAINKDIKISGIDATLRSIVTYSTTEQIVGKWVDGKPIYAKTFSIGAIDGNSCVQYSTGISNINWIVKIDGIFKERVYYSPVNKSHYSMFDYQTGCYYASNTNTINIETGASESLNGGYVTMWYTKTTD